MKKKNHSVSHNNEIASGVNALSERVLISTLYPLGGNYGGMLQAFALQQVIEQLGFNAITINSKTKYQLIRIFASRIRFYLKSFMGRDPGVYPLSPEQTSFVQQRTKQFISKNIKTIDLFGMTQHARRKFLEKCTSIVVGSDQVWRGGYAHIPTQLLDYAKDLNITRISYAASFGADHLIRYSPKIRVEAKNLAKKFDAISVREISAIDICQKEWGIKAEFHVDPTLLLGAEEYLDLLDKADINYKKEGGGLVSYILDNSAAKTSMISDLAKKLDLACDEVLSEKPKNSANWKRSQESFQLQSVESWLKKFVEADFIVTDSFHGTVFAIIFQKPFLTIGNPARGLARFSSLLTLFGLQDRLIREGESIMDLDTSAPKWEAVQEVMIQEKGRAISYLRKHLAI